MINIIDIVYKKQKLIEAIVILLIFLSVSFSFGTNGSVWLWSDYPFVALALVVISLFLSLLWVKIEKKKAQSVSNEISLISKNNSSLLENKLSTLTNRQREVFNLIAQGKSNKEIINELFIELSTLKTHINKIYKALEISNRKEARALGNIRKTDG